MRIKDNKGVCEGGWREGKLSLPLSVCPQPQDAEAEAETPEEALRLRVRRLRHQVLTLQCQLRDQASAGRQLQAERDQALRQRDQLQGQVGGRRGLPVNREGPAPREVVRREKETRSALPGHFRQLVRVHGVYKVQGSQRERLRAAHLPIPKRTQVRGLGPVRDPSVWRRPTRV